MKKHSDTGYIVLAGGRSLRLGRDKNYQTIGGIRLLERVLHVMGSFEGDTVVVTSSGQSFPDLSTYKRLKILTDIFPDRGALGGIYTGLIHSNSFYNFVVASDMPFLNKTLLNYIRRIAPGFDAVVPRIGCHVEPLHAVYSKKCIGPIESNLKKGFLKASSLLSRIKVRYIESIEIDVFDPNHLSLFNVNTEADLARARNLAKENVTLKESVFR